MGNDNLNKLRVEWTLAIAGAIGTLNSARLFDVPEQLVRVFDDAMRVHICEAAPRLHLLDAMEDAWWRTEYEWDAAWVDDEAHRRNYERWSDAFSAAHDRLLRWLEAHAGHSGTKTGES